MSRRPEQRAALPLVEARDRTVWDLLPGDALREIDLYDRFRVDVRKTVSRSASSADIVVVLDATADESGFSDTDTIEVAGKTTGGSTLHRSDCDLLEHREAGRALRLFWRHGSTLVYAGRFELDGEEPYHVTKGGSGRVVFHLRPIGKTVRNPHAGTIVPGDTLGSAELRDRFGVEGGKRVSVSRTGTDLFVFLDPLRNETGFLDAESIHLPGRTIYGSTLRRSDRAVLEHHESGVALRLFWRDGKRFVYAGRFELDGSDPYHFTSSVEPGRLPERKVVFHLRPIGTTVPDPRAHPIVPGDAVRDADLYDRFRVDSRKRISHSATTADIFVFLRPDGTEASLAAGGSLELPGKTTDGSKLRKSDRALLEHRESGQAIRVFWRDGKSLVYAGRFEVDRDDPYLLERTRRFARTANRRPIFHLRPVGTVASEPAEPQPAAEAEPAARARQRSRKQKAPRRSAAAWLWPLALLASCAAIAATTWGWPGSPLRPAVTGLFLLLCPGVALVRLLPFRGLLIAAVLAVAASLSLATIVAEGMLEAQLWSPSGSLAVLIAVTVLAAAAGLLRGSPDQRASRTLVPITGAPA